ncbi:MAG: alpha/beta hydrolase [Gammaproteobacteria bacterium]|nr:alpha/beta hydrolase [Gammaproteobacteria bacterium]
MSVISIEQATGSPIKLTYQDQGRGQPIVFLHPWPLSKKSWEKQMQFFASHGYRAIAFDRRGFGESSKGAADYDYDTLAADIEHVLRELDLHDVTLVGLSMGGGELARYIGKYGTSRVSRAVFIASVPPRFSSGTDPNNDFLAKMQEQLLNDRTNFLQQQMKKFFATSIDLTKSENAIFVEQAIAEAALAETNALVRSIDTWRTDLTHDFEKINIPTLIISGECDQLTPKIMGDEIQKKVDESKHYIIPNASHGLAQTHADAVNKLLFDFITN